MAFHDLESLSAAAATAVANTCEALITAEGREQATPRERELVHTLFPALLGQPWPARPSATIPVGLSGLVVTHRQRQEVMQLLQNGFLYPGSRKGLPYAYVAIHDVHHVIGGYATDPDGELQVLAFSMGLFPDHALLIGLPGLLQFQMGSADPLAGSVAPQLKDQLNAPWTTCGAT